jgi:hypothetical protein
MSVRDLTAYVLIAIGGFVALLNFYLSWIRIPLLRALGRPSPWVSGFPVVGSGMLLVGVWWLRSPGPLAAFAMLLALLDTGGLHWFAGSLVWRWLRRRFQR